MHARLTFKARLRLAAIAAILIPAATAASPALAHDSLSSTSPDRDTVITHAPETVSLTLSEPPADSKNLNLSTIIVTDGAGKTASDGKVTVYGPTLSTDLSEGSPGTYKVLWRAVSSDGHPDRRKLHLHRSGADRTIRHPFGRNGADSCAVSLAGCVTGFVGGRGARRGS